MPKRLAISVLSLCLMLFSFLPLQSAPLLQSPPSQGTVNTNANLRAGPGTNYDKVGYAPAGTVVQIVACNTGCTWYQLAAGQWIAGWLVTPSGNGGGQTCDPSYPTVCIAPAPPDLDCGEIPHSNFQVTGADPHGFDGDNDGVGCEGAPPAAPPSAPQQPPAPQQPDCDTNYSGACIPVVSYDLDCGEIPFRRFQSVGSDPHTFDGDNDGLACES